MFSTMSAVANSPAPTPTTSWLTGGMLPRVSLQNPYAVPSAVPPATPGDRSNVRPRLAWFGVGGTLIAVGAIAAVVLVIPFFQALMREPAVAPGSSFSLHLATDEREALYVEDVVDNATCRVSGHGMYAVLTSGTSDFYIDGDRSWLLLGTFTAPVTGEYDVTCNADSSGDFAYGPNPFRTDRLGAAVGVGGLLGVGGTVICIVTAVRRSRFGRQTVDLSCVPGASPQWGAPQWGAPQWGAPQWGPQWSPPPPAAPPPASAPPTSPQPDDPWASPSS
jgi:hypothetical protein